MSLKKRNRVSAEFSMSSLTDIIFLLLIFFMLTASLVQINIPLAESNAKTIAPTDFTVMITKAGKLTYNGKTASFKTLQRQIQKDVGKTTNRQNAVVTIVAEVGVPWKSVNQLMAIANNLRMRAIIATQPKKN